ncbi:MAG: tyrosine-type recombinase/integrase [Candidatus Diapherotrites archaeon]|nr:tyrosine-type recombinase/integrase [Candidatus Diapherotrites archaeon]
MNPPKENIQLIEGYLAESEAKGYSIYTQFTFLIHILRLLKFTSKKFKELTKSDIIAFSAHLKNNIYEVSKNGSTRKGRYSPVTVEHTLCRVKSFFKWFNQGEFPESVRWFKRTRKLRNGKLPEDLLSPHEITQLIEAADHPRDKALIAVLYESGCRISELLGIKLKDVNFDKYGAYTLVTGKTGTRRVRLIESVPYLQQWMECHPFKNQRDGSVWINFNAKDRLVGLDEAGVRHKLKKLTRRAQLQKKGQPHEPAKNEPTPKPTRTNRTIQPPRKRNAPNPNRKTINPKTNEPTPRNQTSRPMRLRNRKKKKPRNPIRKKIRGKNLISKPLIRRGKEE